MAAASSVNLPDVFRLRERIRHDLQRVLRAPGQPHDLVIDPDLMRPLDRVGGAGFLRENEVDKIFKLERFDKGKTLGINTYRTYLVKPRLTTMKIIADQIENERARGDKRKYRIVMVPRKLYLCEMILEQQGVFGLCDLDCCDLDLLPLDADILSLEAPDFFKSFYLEGELSWLHTVSRSIQNIQSVMGEIPNIYCIGRASKMCHELLKQLSGGDKLIEPDYPKSEIGHLFMIDREVDFVTPLCTQVVYEGLLDDMFGISCGSVEFGRDITQKEQPVKVLLTAQDEMYDQIRNRHFSNVFDILKSKASDLQAVSDKRKTLTSVSDMKNFVANDLRSLNQAKANLTYHIGACEQIINKKNKGDFKEYLQTEHSLLEGSSFRENLNYIEESINRQNNMMQNLKLMCLMSLTNDGIPANNYKSLKTQFVQSHGFEQMLTFYNLGKVGMLREQETGNQSKVTAGVAALTKSSSFKSLRKRLNLIPSVDVDLRSPCDMSYVFSGAYTPLSCKLIEQVVNKEGFTGMEEITKHLPGGVQQDVRCGTPGKGSKPLSKPGSPAKVVLVYFLGGCTYTEISALRFLGRKTGYRFIVATTSIFTGNSLLETIMEKPRI